MKAEQGSFGLAGVDFGETPRGLDAARTPIADRDSFLMLKAFRLVLEALHPNEEGLLLAEPPHIAKKEQRAPKLERRHLPLAGPSQ